MTPSIFTRILNLFFLQALNRFNRVILVLCLVLGAAIGFTKAHLSDNKYASNIVVESPYIKSEIIIDLLNDLKALVAQKELTSISKKLALSSKSSSSLEGLISKQIHDYDGKNIISTNRFTISIYTSTNNLTIIDSIFNGLLNLVENKPYVKKQIAFERTRISNYKKEIIKKIKDLEELQAESVDQIKVTQDIFSYHNNLVDLFERQSDLDSKLQKTVALIVIDNDPFPIKMRADYLSEAIKFALAASLAWLVIIFIRAVTKTIDQFITS